MDKTQRNMSQKNITRFATEAEYNTAFDTLSFPNVSYIDEGDIVKYTEEHPYLITGKSTATEPFTLKINNVYRTVTPKEGGDWKLNIKPYLPLTKLSEFARSKTQLASINFPKKLDTSNVTDMSYAFRDCSSLPFIDLSNLDTSNVTNMNFLFYNCSAITSLDVSNFNTQNVANMMYMFQGCSNLTTLKMCGIGDGTKNVSINNIFQNCTKLANIPTCGPIHNSVDLSPCPLTLDSAKVVLNALSTPYQGAQEIKFNTTTKSKIKANAEAMAIVTEKRSMGWTISL